MGGALIGAVYAYTFQQPQVVCYVRLATIRYLELRPFTNVKVARTLACNVPITLKHLAVNPVQLYAQRIDILSVAQYTV